MSWINEIFTYFGSKLLNRQTMKKLLLSLSSLLLLSVGLAQTGNLYVILTNGTSLSYPLSEIRKLDFANDQLNLHQTDGTVFSWNFTLLDYYAYQEPVGINELNNYKEVGVALFPNPTEGILKLKYLLPTSEVLDVKIYNINGVLVKEEKIKFDSNAIHNMDVSKLSHGQYICKIKGAQFDLSKTFIKN